MNQSPIITALIAHVVSECKAVDLEQRHRNTLDEIYPKIKIGYLTFSPSRIVEELDPTAFRIGVSEDTEGMTEVDGSYYEGNNIHVSGGVN